jgi:HEAT repeat protein
MTTALMLSTLIGAAAGYPLLKWFSRVDGRRLERAGDWWEARLTAMLPVIALTPFLLYPLTFALTLNVLAVLAALLPSLALGLPLPFLPPLAAMIWLPIPLLAVGRTLVGRKWRGWPKLPVRRAAVYLSYGILLAEMILASANVGILFWQYPRLCAWIGRERAVASLGYALREYEPDLRAVAREEALKIGAPALPMARELLHEAYGLARRDAAAIIVKVQLKTQGRVTEELPTEILARLLSDGDGRVRNYAAGELMKLGETAMPTVIGELTNLNFILDRDLALHTLRQLPAAKVVPAFLWAIGNSLHASGGSGDYGRELASFGEGAIPPLIDGLSLPGVWPRHWARAALADIGQPAVEPLLKTLRSGPALGRGEAALVLGKIRAASAVPALLEALRDPEQQVSDNAIAALGDVGDRRATLPLIAEFEMRERQSWSATYRRALVITALGNLHDPAAVPTLVNAFRSGGPDVREQAMHALAKTAWGDGNRSAQLKDLIQALDSNDLKVRAKAIDALGRTGDWTVLPALERADRADHAIYPERADPSRCQVCKAIRDIKAREQR